MLVVRILEVYCTEWQENLDERHLTLTKAQLVWLIYRTFEYICVY